MQPILGNYFYGDNVMEQKIRRDRNIGDNLRQLRDAKGISHRYAPTARLRHWKINLR